MSGIAEAMGKNQKGSALQVSSTYTSYLYQLSSLGGSRSLPAVLCPACPLARPSAMVAADALGQRQKALLPC